MKILILTALLIGFVVAQNIRRDPRCPANNNGEVVRLPHPTDCASFLICHFGGTIETRCPDHLHWSTNSFGCESPERAGCTYPNQRPIPGPFPPNFPQNPNPVPFPPNFPQNPNPVPFPPNVPQRPIIPNPRPEIEHPDYLNCPPVDTRDRIVYFPYHLNCSHFYQCVNGRAIL